MFIYSIRNIVAKIVRNNSLPLLLLVVTYILMLGHYWNVLENNDDRLALCSSSFLGQPFVFLIHGSKHLHSVLKQAFVSLQHRTAITLHVLNLHSFVNLYVALFLFSSLLLACFSFSFFFLLTIPV
jgi:hypothetical protein